MATWDQKNLRELVLRAIGERTKSEFADECGFTRQHLSRILYSENMPRPSKLTLNRMAEHSNVPLEEFLDAAGYNQKQEPYIPYTKEDTEKYLHNILAKGFSMVLESQRIYENLYEFFDEFRMAPENHDVLLQLCKKQEYVGDIPRKGAEYFSNAYITYDRGLYRSAFPVVLFFSETKGGKIFVTDYASDGATLMALGTISNNWLEALSLKKQEAKNREYICFTKRNVRSEFIQSLLDGFDDPYPYTYVGFGIQVDEVVKDEEVIRRFILNHKGSFCTSLQAAVLCDRIQNGESPIDVLQAYTDSGTGEEGIAAAIAKIIRNETGFEFSLFISDDETKKCIMIPEDSDQYNIEEMVFTTRQYARELGLRKFGQCFIESSRYPDTNMVFMA